MPDGADHLTLLLAYQLKPVGTSMQVQPFHQSTGSSVSPAVASIIPSSLSSTSWTVVSLKNLTLAFVIDVVASLAEQSSGDKTAK